MSSKILIRVKTMNAAFEDNPGEVGNVLRKVADRIDELLPQVERLRDADRIEWKYDELILDSNGNTCGSIRIYRL